MEIILWILGGLTVAMIVATILIGRVMLTGQIFDVETPPHGTFQRKDGE